MVSCRRCGLVYMNPRDAGIKDLYRKVVDSAYLDSWSERAGTFKEHLRVLSAYRPGIGTLLDIGCYAGIFLDEAKKAGYDVTGIEPSEWACEQSRIRTGAKVICASWDEASLPEGFFDVVTMWDIVEHLEDPSACLKKAHGWLKRDGIIAVTTHNIKGWFPRLMGKRYPWLMRFHIYHFDIKTLSAILLKNGLETVLVRPYRKTISLKYALSRLGVMVHGKLFERIKFSFNTGDLFMVIAKKI